MQTKSVSKYIHQLVFLIEILLLWEYIPRLVGVNTTLFPGSFSVMRALWHYVLHGSGLSDSLQSLGRAVVGCVIGVAIGSVCALCSSNLRFRNLVHPVLVFFRNMPPVALSPIFIVWFGIDVVGKISVIAFASMFPVWSAIDTGMQNIPRQYQRMATILRLSSMKKMLRVTIPSLLPYCVVGVQGAISVSFVMIFVSELAGASSGIGYYISTSQLAYQIPDMLAGLIVLGFLGTFVMFMFNMCVKSAFPWLGKTAL